MNERKVKRHMLSIAPDHIDDCQELNTTSLVESACHDLNLWCGEHGDDIPEELWDWAFEVSDKAEANHLRENRLVRERNGQACRT
jgi:hypothetical protein